MQEFRKKREEEEEGNILKAIEHKAFDSKREMEIADALDEIRSMNARQSKVDPEFLLDQMMIKKKDENDIMELDFEEMLLLQEMEKKETTIKRITNFENNETQSINENINNESQNNNENINNESQNNNENNNENNNNENNNNETQNKEVEFKKPLSRLPHRKREQTTEPITIIPGKKLGFKKLM